MVASQTGENRVFAQWCVSWFADPMPICSGEELSAMPGYLTVDEIAEARQAPDATFDVIFVRLMTQHHTGAVRMADDEWHSSGDSRLRVMAHAIRHEQQGEIALMNRVQGIEAVRQATRNMFANNLQHRQEAGVR
jgi:uncharacterized protein (DUF305 family)